jgi:uncharacterized tellurite resistance protein B-like protein
MSDKSLIFSLAKVIIAAAWADGHLSHEEINSLKDLLFRLPRKAYKQQAQITGREWAALEIYFKTPVDAKERSRLVAELAAELRKPDDRALALSALEDLVQADGIVTDEEVSVMHEIKSALNAVDLGIIAQLSGLLRGPMRRRSQAVANAPNREEFLDDFIKNRVYYTVRQRLGMGEDDLNVAETELRKLSLAGGLMARVAHADREVTEDEIDVMTSALRKWWGISLEAASIVAEIAVSEVGADLDYFRLTREFATGTLEDERVRFLDVLFAVANADGHISHDENEEILRISSSLNLTREQFVNAKLKTLGK